MSFRVCDKIVFHNNKPWFEFNTKMDYTHIIHDIYDLGYKPPFQVHIGETLFFRDDGSLTLSFVKKNRIMFPSYEC